MTDQALAQPAPSATAPAPVGKVYLGYALALLLLVNILNFVDRQVVSILAEPIKRDLGLADWQLGAMTGLAFAIFYTVLGVPIARIAERAHRPALIAICIATWSSFTALCGMAQSFVQMIFFRIGVGVGEAGCTPAAHSLISDYAPPEKRASSIAIYAMGTPLGSVAGLMIGGLAADAWGWRAAFLVCGAPGVIIALLAWLTLSEPRKKLRAIIAEQESRRETALAAFGELARIKTFWLLGLGTACVGVVGYGGGAFLPSFFFRNHAEELAAIAASFGMQPIGFFSLAFGAIVGAGGLLGTWAGGALADRFGARSRAAYALIPAIGSLLSYPLYFAAMFTPSIAVATILIAGVNVFGNMWAGPVFASAQSVVRPQLRATAAAVTLLLINLIGLGIGPLLVGAMSDYFAGPLGMGANEGLRYAQAAITAVGLLSIAFYVAASRTIAADFNETSSQSH